MTMMVMIMILIMMMVMMMIATAKAMIAMLIDNQADDNEYDNGDDADDADADNDVDAEIEAMRLVRRSLTGDRLPSTCLDGSLPGRPFLFARPLCFSSVCEQDCQVHSVARSHQLLRRLAALHRDSLHGQSPTSCRSQRGCRTFGFALMILARYSPSCRFKMCTLPQKAAMEASVITARTVPTPSDPAKQGSKIVIGTGVLPTSPAI